MTLIILERINVYQHSVDFGAHLHGLIIFMNLAQ